MRDMATLALEAAHVASTFLRSGWLREAWP